MKKRKNQLLHENQCGMGNEGGSVQSDSRVGEAVQCLTGTHISLVSNVVI